MHFSISAGNSSTELDCSGWCQRENVYLTPSAKTRQLSMRARANDWDYQDVAQDGSLTWVARQDVEIDWEAKGGDGSECPLEWLPVVSTGKEVSGYESLPDNELLQSLITSLDFGNDRFTVSWPDSPSEAFDEFYDEQKRLYSFELGFQVWNAWGSDEVGPTLLLFQLVVEMNEPLCSSLSPSFTEAFKEATLYLYSYQGTSY